MTCILVGYTYELSDKVKPFGNITTFGFLVFSDNMKWKHWPEMG